MQKSQVTDIKMVIFGSSIRRRLQLPAQIVACGSSLILVLPTGTVVASVDGSTQVLTDAEVSHSAAWRSRVVVILSWGFYRPGVRIEPPAVR